MNIRILTSELDPWAEIANYQKERSGLSGQFGATACFVGSMRDFNEGEDVSKMHLEHYPGMTERQLEAIAKEACERFSILDVLIAHRVGELFPEHPIMLVAVWSAHRAGAFDACRWIVEELKHNAPFWKKETLLQGERWVSKNTSG